MKEFKEILVWTIPFIVSAVLLYPFMAIVGANTDPFMWERIDRVFYGIFTWVFGAMLCARLMAKEKV